MSWRLSRPITNLPCALPTLFLIRPQQRTQHNAARTLDLVTLSLSFYILYKLATTVL